MKILIFSTTFFPNIGGAEKYIHTTAQELSAQGHDVTVLVPHPGYNFNHSYRIIGIRFLGLPKIFLNTILTLNLLIACFLTKSKIVLAVSAYEAGYCATLAKSIVKDLKIIIRPTGSDVQLNEEIGYGKRINSKVDHKVRWSLNQADLLVSNSEDIFLTLLELGASHDKIIKISNGIDFSRYENVSYDENLKNIKIPLDKKLLLSVNSISPKRNYENLLRAFDLLASKMEDVILVIVGKGEENILKLKDSLEHSDRVYLLGSMPQKGDKVTNLPPDNLLSLYAHASLFAFPSILEGQPNSLLDAFAMKKAVVCGDCEGVRDLANANNALIADVLDPVDFAEKMEYLLKNKAFAIGIGNKAFQTAKEKDIKLMVKLLIERIDKIL